MTLFWSAWIWFWVLGMLFSLSWVLYSNYKAGNTDIDHHRKHETHDGIGEAFAPIPKWWAYTMGGTIVFAFLYLFLFPGLGLYKGVLGWTSAKVLEREQEKMDPKTNDLLAKWANTSIEELMQDRDAMLFARRDFRNNCSACHGNNAEGQQYFPNLTDDDWLYGGTEEAIKETLRNGRKGAMPAWDGRLTPAQIKDVNNYVRHFSQEEAPYTEQGEKLFGQYCAVCHGKDAKGNYAMGAPNLTDDIWLYGGTYGDVAITLNVGRNGHMPAQSERLGEERIHLMTAFIKRLGQDAAAASE